jgi:hypothetical protein
MNAIRLPNHPGGGTDHRLADIRARLDVANDRARLLWTIDVDGLDEAPEQVSRLRELINHCWARGSRNASPASVVVTCRSDTGSRTKEDLISRWLDTPEPDLVDGVGFVEFDDFVAHELVDAARLLNGAPEQRIIRAASPIAAGAPDQYPPVSEDILRSLRHPVVWGRYASLPESDRTGVLDREAVCLKRLAEQLHGRFLRRCLARKRWRDDLMLERALPAIAQASSDRRAYVPEAWDGACEMYLDRTEARNLYTESLSYGIVERDAGRSWRWGHPFLVAYLATLAGGDAHE